MDLGCTVLAGALAFDAEMYGLEEPALPDLLAAAYFLLREGTCAMACCVFLASILPPAELLSRADLDDAYLLLPTVPFCLSAVFFTLSLPRSESVERFSF